MGRMISQALIWIAVVAWSLWFGGLMYEMAVITPLWSSALPESVIEWNSRPQYAVIPTKFYVPVAFTTILASLFALILRWRSREWRIWLILSTAGAILTLAFTLVYFLPKNEVIFYSRTAGLSGDEITAIANAWISANLIRVVIMMIGFFSALKAFGRLNEDRNDEIRSS